MERSAEIMPYCNAPHYDSPHPESKLPIIRPGSEIL